MSKAQEGLKKAQRELRVLQRAWDIAQQTLENLAGDLDEAKQEVGWHRMMVGRERMTQAQVERLLHVHRTHPPASRPFGKLKNLGLVTVHEQKWVCSVDGVEELRKRGRLG